MSEKNPKDNNENNPPLDDYGIDHDRLLEICEKIIEITHKKYVEEQHTPKNAAELRDVAETLEKVWSLTNSILDLDDFMRSVMQAYSDGMDIQTGLPEDFGIEDIDDLDNEEDSE